MEKRTMKKKIDLINHPPHYKKGNMEVIDVIEAFLTPEEYRGYIKGNNIKYVLRETEKGGDADIGKARWYLNRFFDYVKGRLNAS
tara:strand:+ start:1058 stop:1312 length:255 start_codon:yes stop_codon:yes gene_type:complete